VESLKSFSGVDWVVVFKYVGSHGLIVARLPTVLG